MPHKERKADAYARLAELCRLKTPNGHDLIVGAVGVIEKLQTALETISRNDFEVESKVIASNALADLVALKPTAVT